MSWITADWPAPPGIKAITTLRTGGSSRGQYAGLNLAEYVNDDAQAVERNRQTLRSILDLPDNPAWLRQVHGIEIVNAETVQAGTTADGSYTRETGVICAVMTADCLPVVLCDNKGSVIAAVHAGWRGLIAGILEAAVQTLDSKQLMAWLGPAIGPNHFEVGNEVRTQFLAKSGEFAAFFRLSQTGKWLADIARMAEFTLKAVGVTEVYRCPHCTFSAPELFYSYRRDNTTGRMATLIWKVTADATAEQR